jgi:hypothetical protein
VKTGTKVALLGGMVSVSAVIALRMFGPKSLGALLRRKSKPKAVYW